MFRRARALALGVAVSLALVASPAPAQQVGATARQTATKPRPGARTCAQIRAATAARPIGRAIRGPTVEGITEYSLSNGLRVLLFPDPSKPTVTVNITYLVGSRHEAYGETGMAHLLEHLVFKGTPCHPNIPQELTERGANPNGTTWYRPHQLLRDLRRHRRQPGVGARPRGRPDGEQLHRQEGPRLRVHRGPQRVRNGRERSGRHPGGAGAVDRVPLAQLRQLDHRGPGRHRERTDRAAPGLLPEVLPAGQRDSGGRRQVRRGQDPPAHRAEVRPDPEARSRRRAEDLADLHARSRPGRRARGDPAPGRGCAGR